jgi:hypothetical protein
METFFVDEKPPLVAIVLHLQCIASARCMEIPVAY